MALVAILIASAAPESPDDGPPALWPWNVGETLIEYHLAQLAAAGVRDIVVVLGYDAERIIPLVARDNVEPIIDPRWASGPASSLRVGASAVPRGADTAVLVYIGEPRPAAIFATLLDAHFLGGAAITRPSWEGSPGAPIIVGDAILIELRSLLDGAGNLDGLLDRHASEIADVPFESSVVQYSLSTYTSWENMQAMYAT
jgi:molybdenum cofactor cytidylyltransferase